MLENRVYQIMNPFSNGGFMVSDFGMQLIFEMKGQNYMSGPIKNDKEYVTMMWPPDLGDKLIWLTNNQHNKDFEKAHSEFLAKLSPSVDIFCFGSL